MKFKKISKENSNYAINLRREFHMHPELSNEEHWTSAKIVSELEFLGIEYERVGTFNVIGKIDTKKSGKKVAIRADFDALPITEISDKEYKSQNEGVMHACGHDAHTAMVLAAAKAISENIDEYSGEVYFCFQHGEERSLGAKEMVAYLKEKGGIDHIFATHVTPTIKTGTISMKDNAMWAGIATWEIEVVGKGGHGSKPHTSIDPIKPLCEIVQRISALPVNAINVFEPVVVSTCTFNAGTAFNIVPERAKATGTIRYFSDDAFKQVMSFVERVVDNIAKSHGAKGEFICTFGDNPPVINSVSANKVGRKTALECGLEIIDKEPMMGSDNYSLFTETFDGFYTLLGVGNDEFSCELHDPRFDLNEEALEKGIEFFIRGIKNFSENN